MQTTPQNDPGRLDHRSTLFDDQVPAHFGGQGDLATARNREHPTQGGTPGNWHRSQMQSFNLAALPEPRLSSCWAAARAGLGGSGASSDQPGDQHNQLRSEPTAPRDTSSAPPLASITTSSKPSSRVRVDWDSDAGPGFVIFLSCCSLIVISTQAVDAPCAHPALNGRHRGVIGRMTKAIDAGGLVTGLLHPHGGISPIMPCTA